MKARTWRSRWNTTSPWLDPTKARPGSHFRAAIARPGLRIPACDHLDRCHGSPARGGVGEHELWAIAQNGRPVAGAQGRRRHYLDIKNTVYPGVTAEIEIDTVHGFGTVTYIETGLYTTYVRPQ
jgi:hypothetical protein